MAIIAIASTKLTFGQGKTAPAFNQVLNSYYNLKNALATDKADLAIEKAKVLTSKIDAIPHHDLAGAQHTLWMEQAKIIKGKAAELISEKDIKVQRKSFEGISYAMIKTVRNIKFNSAPVYVQHCPMAKASWLNEKENIENPYYGSMMFDCGDIAEKIKAN